MLLDQNNKFFEMAKDAKNTTNNTVNNNNTTNNNKIKQHYKMDKKQIIERRYTRHTTITRYYLLY